MTPTAILEVRNLAAVRGRAALFADVSFTLSPGQVMLVRGPNGSGKTTLLRILAGLGTAVDGALSWCGERMAPLDGRLRGAVAFLGHAAAVKDELTAHDNLATLLTLAGEKDDHDAVRNGLEAAGLTRQADLAGRFLSQGQRRRLGLARLAASRRPLWILDEPATALDDAATAWLGQLVESQLARGGIVVAATHQPLAFGQARIATLALG